jgi:glycosyltransferase involved in cell wall biosynthesis
VVASGVGGIVDLVIDEQTGLRVPEKDSPALARAIARVLTDTGLAQRLGHAGYEHVQQNYSWPAIIARLEHVYGDLLNRPA